MNGSVIDSYQLSSLIELTSNLADDSMHAELSTQKILLNAVNKLLWTLNFDYCMMINNDNQVECLYGESHQALSTEIEKLAIKELKNNARILINQHPYYLTYQILPLEADKTNILVFLQQSQAFNSSSLIIIELFSAAVKRLLITKAQEHKRLKLKNEAQVLLRSNQLKSEFLANMSHELKTPMNGILSLVKLLQTTELSQSQLDMLNTIYQSTENLLGVVTDVLEYSKLENNSIELLAKSFSLNALLNDLLTDLEPEASIKGLALNCTVAASVPQLLIGDIYRIKQLLKTLLNNAVKFTQKGSVDIFASGEQIDNTHLNLTIKIIDTGIGITEKTKKWLFEPFTQADSSTTREYGGTGLGLAIASKLVNAMNGRIKVESKAKFGSTFILTLPLEIELQIQNEANTSHIQAFQSSQLQPHTILVVEDNLINQKVTGLILQKLGYTFDIAENGQVALDMLEQKHYTFIFMDIQMPVMNGYDATTQIIERYKEQRPFIIAMTANTFNEDKEKCLNLGMDDFIAKPVSEQEFIRVLSQYSTTIKNQ